MKTTIKQKIKELLNEQKSTNEIVDILLKEGFKINTIKWYCTTLKKYNNELKK